MSSLHYSLRIKNWYFCHYCCPYVCLLPNFNHLRYIWISEESFELKKQLIFIIINFWWNFSWINARVWNIWEFDVNLYSFRMNAWKSFSHNIKKNRVASQYMFSNRISVYVSVKLELIQWINFWDLIHSLFEKTAIEFSKASIKVENRR